MRSDEEMGRKEEVVVRLPSKIKNHDTKITFGFTFYVKKKITQILTD